MNVRTSTLRIEGLEDRTTPAPVTFANDNWHFLADVDSSGSLTSGDTVINNNDSFGPGTVTAIYGVTGFGAVTTGTFTGSLPLSATINDAIANTDVGGTVNVLEGTYEQQVLVNKSVAVLGAQAGVDARTRTGVPESIVRGELVGTERSSAFVISANNATVDGFTTRDQTLPGAGILMVPSTSGVSVRNNIVTNNVIGIAAGSSGPSTIERNLIDSNNSPGAAGATGLYSEQTNGLTIDNNEIRNHTVNSPVTFAAVGPGAHINLTFSNNNVHDNVSGVFTLAVTGGLFQGNTIKTTGGAATALTFAGANAGVDVTFNDLSGNLKGLRIADFGFFGLTPNSDIEAHFNDFSNSTDYGAGISNEGSGLTDGYIGTLDLSGNWWGDITGPTFATNPGGVGELLRNDFGDVVDFQPWLIYAPDSNPAVAGVQVQTSITVPAQTANFSPTNNNYRRLVNVVDLLQNGQSVTLSGTFDWSEPNAAAAWALGNDGLASTADDFSLLVRPNLHGVSLTAASLGSARIQGPGDLAAANLEGFLLFDGGDNQNWTISNLEIFDLDLGLGFFNGPGGIDAFNNLKILNNHIRIPDDLNATVAPIDVNQNIGIHFSFGENQTIQGNQIDMPGNGVSDGLNLSLIVGMQSNTAALDAYDGLLIDGNILRVLDAQSASPSRILGIWENGHVHSNNVTISNNQFLNLAAGNNPALNLQRAFRVTSHSSATSTVTYSGNTVRGANIGFEWLNLISFAGREPVQLIENTITNSNTGVLIQSEGSATLVRNSITGIGAGHGVHVLAGRLAPAGTGVNAAEGNIISGGTGDGIRIEAVSTVEGAVFNNNLGSNTGLAINNLSAVLVNASGNWFGTDTAAGVAAEVSGNVDYSPWLDVGTDTTGVPGFQGDFRVLHVSGASPQAGTGGAIQEGIDLAADGGTVTVEAGIYAENLVVAKSLALDGAGPTTILSASGGIGIDVSSPALFVTVKDLAIDGADVAIEATDLDSFTLSNVDISGNTTGGTISNVTIVNVFTDAVTTNQTVNINPTQVEFVGQGTFGYSNVDTFTITTGPGDDTFNVPGAVTTNFELDGGTNSPVGDTLNVNPLALPRITFVNIENVIGVPPVGIVEGDLFIFGTAANNKVEVTIRSNVDVVVKIDGVESLVVPLEDITGRIIIHGLGGNDTITVAGSVPVNAEIQGGLGNDKITGGRGHDLLDGGLGNDTVNGGKGNDTLVGSVDLDVLAGQADSDTLIGPNVAADWAITGANAGRINDSARFNTMESLVGGTDDDTFLVRASGSVKGRIDGGGGVNKLDYTKVSGQTIINLSIGTATRTGGISNIRDVDGGNGPSVIVGDSQNNVLRGFNGRDILIGGGGLDLLEGGDKDDILIGGTTTHDSSNTALTALINEWKSTASYDIRIDRLMRVRAGGVNGAYSLTTLTVFDDGVANILNGEANLDFYFKGALDVTDAGPDETVINL